jgi:hypothetical protein
VQDWSVEPLTVPIFDPFMQHKHRFGNIESCQYQHEAQSGELEDILACLVVRGCVVDSVQAIHGTNKSSGSPQSRFDVIDIDITELFNLEYTQSSMRKSVNLLNSPKASRVPSIPRILRTILADGMNPSSDEHILMTEGLNGLKK